jgi:hypothetical protein
MASLGVMRIIAIFSYWIDFIIMPVPLGDIMGIIAIMGYFKTVAG